MSTISRSRGWMLTLVLLAAGLLLSAAPAAQEPRLRGRVEGRFLSAGEGTPVAGAKIKVLVEGLPRNQRLLEAVSNAEGRYVLELPVGHAQFWGLETPAGYYDQEPRAWSAFVTTPNEPNFSCDFILEKGTPWRVEATGAAFSQENRPGFSAFRYFGDGGVQLKSTPTYRCGAVGNEKGQAVLALPPTGGTFRCNAALGGYQPLLQFTQAKLDLAPAFDPNRLAGPPELIPGRKAVKLTDAAGRTAIVEDVEVVVDNGQAVLRFVGTPVDPKQTNRVTLRARVVDERGQPLASVHFRTAFRSERGGGSSMFEGDADAAGRFEMRDLVMPATFFAPTSRISLLVSKSGYFNVETKDLDMQEVKSTGLADFGEVQLRPGHKVRGRVVDDQGQPCIGAVVTNHTNYFLYANLRCRTDAEGRFVMPDLAPGKHQFEVRFGERYGKIEWDTDAENEAVITLYYPRKIGMRSGAVPIVKADVPKPPPAGMAAEWNLTPPTKEPTYQQKPLYSLLVFGPDRSKRVWMVLDGKTLYVDRNGNGDLTEAGERFEPDPQPNMQLGNPGYYSGLNSYSFSVESPATGEVPFTFIQWVRAANFEPTTDFEKLQVAEQKRFGYETGNLIRQSGGKGGGAWLAFMPKPADAPVSVWDGPLTFVVRSAQERVLERGKGGCNLEFRIVSPGRPHHGAERPQYTCLATTEVPEGAYLEVEIEFPAKAANELPPRRKFLLKERCCGDCFHGTVHVPEEAGKGVAKIAVKMVGWDKQNVAPALVQVPIAD